MLEGRKKETKKKIPTLSERIKQRMRRFVIGATTAGAVAGGIAGTAMYYNSKKSEETKNVTKIEKTISKVEVEDDFPTGSINEIRRSAEGKKLKLTIGQNGEKKIELLGKPKNSSEDAYLTYIFQYPKDDEMQRIKEDAKKKSVAEPKKEIGDKNKDLYYMIWNVYREANIGVKYSSDLIKNINALRDEIKKTTSQGLAEKVSEKREMLFSLLAKKEKEEQESKKQTRAERLAIMLTVLSRCESAKFPKEISQNILRDKAFSWTFEKKFPVALKTPSIKDGVDEKISFDALLEIKNLTDDFLKGKTITQAKKLIKSEIAYILNKKIEDIPDVTMYNTKSLAPSEDGKFSKKAQKITSSVTKERLRDVEVLKNFGIIKSFDAGSHTFYIDD